MVAHTHVKTPTAAATLLIEQLVQTLRRIDDAQTRLTLSVNTKISNLKSQISNLSTLIPTLALRRVTDARHRIEMLEARLPIAIDRHLTTQRHRLENFSLQLRSHDPQLLLERGYSITLLNGHAIHDPAQLRPGDEIETRIEKGTFKSIVK
jgi:exodeoxyribonuclease VII large subunit